MRTRPRGVLRDVARRRGAAMWTAGPDIAVPIFRRLVIRAGSEVRILRRFAPLSTGLVPGSVPDTGYPLRDLR